MATLFGTSGNETISGSSSADTIYGGSTTSPNGTGNDTINAGNGDDIVFGGDGDDILNGENHDDTLIGGAGNDSLNGGSGTDKVDYSQDGGTGAVTVNLATGSATDSFGNTDTLSSIETIIGTALNDTIVASVSNFTDNSFNGGAGTDTVNYSASTNALTINLSTGSATGTGIGTDTLTSIEIVRTGSGNDVLTAAAGGSTFIAGIGTDQLTGGVGNDTLVGGSGNDTLSGGSGTDTVDYSQDGGTGAVTVNLATGSATDSFGNTDTLSGIENLVGTGLNDTVTANVTNGANNAFSGGSGTDTVTYAASTNALTVDLSAGTVTGTGVGTDTLTAIEIIRTGSGNDVFSAGAGGLGGVTTLDGGSGNDTLTTSAATFDLTGKTLTSIEQITTTNATGTAFTTDSVATALLIHGAGGSDSVTLTGAAFTAAQRTQLFSQGVETIIDSSGTHTPNTAPTAVADTGTAVEDGGPVILTAASLLANDTDPDAGDTKTLVSVNGTGALGSVSINGAGNVVYDPGAAFQSLAAGATTTDTFTYTMQDSAGAQSTATVTITITGVNDGPVAGTVADQSTDEDTPLTVAKTLILAGASDIDGGTVTLTGGSALHGTVSLDANGDLLYTPNGNANGPDVVTYTLSDGQGGTTTGTFNVGVAAVNDDPTAGSVADQSTDEDTPLTVAKTLILAGAGDVDGGTVTLTGGSALHGTVSLDANGDLLYTPNGNANGPDVVTYTLSDGQGGTTTGTFNVGVSAVNDDPTAGSVADQSTDEDTPLTVAKTLILAGAGDVDGDTVTLTGGSALHGSVSLNADGDLVYTPDANANGPDVVTYTLSDGNGGTTTGTFNVGVGAVNDDPTAGTVADQSTDEDTPLTVAKTLILAGAGDIDGDTVTLTGGSALHGSVSLDANGDLVYTPDANANGPDVVTYTLSDGQGGTTTGTFNVGVAAVNDDPTAGTVADQSTDEDTPLTVAKTLILAGAGDIDGDTVTLTGGSALHGSVSLNADGDLVYTPDANANGPDVVTYTLSDGQGGTTTGTFNVGVAAVNDDPTAGSVADQSTDEDTPLTVAKTLILAGAGDIDGDTVTLTGGSALHGSVSLNADGDLVYTPDANANGPDVVTYTLSDGNGGTTTGTFNVGVAAVNDDPVAGTVADQSTDEDTPLTISKAVILAGASDVDGDTITLIGGSALGGTVSLDANGDLVCTPDANINGTGVVTYTLSDGHGGTTTGTFNITVAAVNDDPLAGTVADQNTDEDTPLTVSKAVILAGASDVDGDTVTLTGGSALHGSVSLNADGDLVYTPDANANGPDVITYTLSDGNGGTTTGTFNVGVAAVNDDPTAGSVADQNTDEDTPLTVAKTLILAGAGDVDGDTVTLTGGSALHGTVSLDANGDLVYTPDANANGPDVVTYTLSDGNGGTTTGTFNVGVGAVNDDPIAGTVADQSTDEDTPLTVSKAVILAGASDVDGDTVTLTGGSALHGSVSLNADGDLVYTPDADANGPDVVTYTLSDGNGGTTTGTFNVGVTAVNDDPVAGTVADQSTDEDTPLTVSKAVILAGASDVDGDTVTLTGGSALHGTVSLDANGDLVYTPDAGANGPDVVTYTLSDGNGGTTTGTFNVGVASVDDQGLAQADAFATDETLAITTGNVFADNGSGADSDLDGPLTVAAVNGSAAAVGVMITLASGAHLTLSADGTFIYDPNHAFDHLPGADSGATGLTGTDSFTYTLAGGGTATVTVTVSGIDSDDTLVGTAGDDTLKGGIGADHIDGADGNDILRGGAGGDTLDGGTGTDLVTYFGTTAAVTVNLQTGVGSGGEAQGDSYIGIENVHGSTAGDTITGNGGANLLRGYEGNDILRGGTGGDTLDGGTGTDLVTYFGTNVAVTVNLQTGAGSGGEAQGDFYIGIENVNGSTAGDTITGNGGANALSGYEGNDILRGGAGGDTLDGGNGSDTASYYLSSIGVSVDLATGVGHGGDAEGDTLTGFEILSGSQGDDHLAGDALANTLQGWNGNDEIAGAGGNDTVEGGDGNDSLSGDTGADVLRGGAGADQLNGGDGSDTVSYYFSSIGVTVDLATGTGHGGDAEGDTLTGFEILTGSQGNDSLTGDALANTLQGWNGNDVLEGGIGKDALTGGAGADRFVFSAISDSLTGVNADRITDFSHAQGDKIDLSAIDADTGVAGDQAFTFIGSGLYTHHAGELRFAFTSPGITTIAGDVNGDGVSDFHIQLTGNLALVAADFVL